MSDTDSDVYSCEVWFIFAQCMCFVLFLVDVTAIYDTLFICMHL